MHLLIVGLNFAPELTGIGKYSGEMAAWFAARGHKVSVITTRPYYPEWKRPPGFAAWTWRSETWQGCRVTRCPLYVPQRPTGLRRILHLSSFGLSSIPAAVVQAAIGRADLVAVMAPTLFSAPTGLAIARLMSAKAWLHVLDLEVDAAFELGFIRNRQMIAAARKVERSLMCHFDLVSTISSKMSEAIERKGVASERMMLFPNWVDTHQFFPMEKPVTLRDELSIPIDRCVVLYSGSMGQKQGLEHVIAAARLSMSQSAVSPLFLLAGAGPVRAELERSAEDLPNVRFLPLQPAERFNEFLNVAGRYPCAPAAARRQRSRDAFETARHFSGRSARDSDRAARHRNRPHACGIRHHNPARGSACLGSRDKGACLGSSAPGGSRCRSRAAGASINGFRCDSQPRRVPTPRAARAGLARD